MANKYKSSKSKIKQSDQKILTCSWFTGWSGDYSLKLSNPCTAWHRLPRQINQNNQHHIDASQLNKIINNIR